MSSFTHDVGVAWNHLLFGGSRELSAWYQPPTWKGSDNGYIRCKKHKHQVVFSISKAASFTNYDDFLEYFETQYAISMVTR